MAKSTAEFIPLNIALLTVSDSRDTASDTSGDWLQQAVSEEGHRLADRALVADNRYAIRAVVSGWIASENVQVVIINGGIGFHSKNSTPEALLPLFDREIEGFGELFRMISWEEIASATLQSRALAGMAPDADLRRSRFDRGLRECLGKDHLPATRCPHAPLQLCFSSEEVLNHV